MTNQYGYSPMGYPILGMSTALVISIAGIWSTPVLLVHFVLVVIALITAIATNEGKGWRQRKLVGNKTIPQMIAAFPRIGGIAAGYWSISFLMLIPHIIVALWRR